MSLAMIIVLIIIGEVDRQKDKAFLGVKDSLNYTEAGLFSCEKSRRGRATSSMI